MSDTIPTEDLIGYLSKIPLFSKADDSVLKHLAGITTVNRYKAGETVVQKGDLGDTMYVIISGMMKVHDGEHKVAELKKGEFFGETSIFENEPRSMSVSAIEASVLGMIRREDFYNLLKEFPTMTQDMIAVVNKRLRNQNERLINEFKGREEQLKELVRIRTLELEQKNDELTAAMERLQKSQEQLVQSEKLASLGQLIAGIAHEIQNPLNFVNNFSQLSKDLVSESKTASSDEERDEILGDLEKNLEKINHHGKRADSIVKNMLEHSRTSSGEKQPTNINQLCKEYVSLAYQGMRANNQEFNCDIQINLDDKVTVIQAVSQDISRVLLNIINNAFYAIHEQGKKLNGSYNPTFSLKTAVDGKMVTITISDNGTGVPEAIKTKIFEPFYTTKPTGQGTGLGLSLSFDIVKAHGGEIVFNSRENEGTNFIISLPLTS